MERANARRRVASRIVAIGGGGDLAREVVLAQDGRKMFRGAAEASDMQQPERSPGVLTLSR